MAILIPAQRSCARAWVEASLAVIDNGDEAYNVVMIFSHRHEAIRQSLLVELGRGVTVLKAIGGYTATEQDVLYCVVTRLELTKLETLVKAHDETAFIVISPAHEVIGGVVKKRQYH